MKIKKYILGAVMAVAVAVSCSPDPSLYPLPYDDRATGSYLRAYRISSNVWDLNDTLNSAFTVVYESVDKNFGADLSEIRVFATHRSGATGFITDEILVKTFNAAAIAANFAKVSEPTYSDYLRSTPLSVTYNETMAALRTLKGVDPDGVNGVDPQCTGIFPKTCPAVPFPYALPGASELQNNDRIIFRVAIVDNQGRLFTVANPQNTIAPYLGNPTEANITPNLTGGLFYASPMLFTMTVVRTTTTGNANAYGGAGVPMNYRMTQVARWQPDHSAAQHQAFPQAWIDQFIFGSSPTDSSQTVILNSVTNGLPTERTFTCTYRGQTISMVINLENTATGLSAAAITTLNTAINTPGQPASTPFGLGFPAGTSTANLGTVFVPLANTTVDCTSNREFYHVTPLGGAFAGNNTLPWGLPRATVPNRGAYRNDRDGSVIGDRFLIAVDDDADEYGRRNGYCNWYTRVLLVMERIP
jgi:hypothetical protein